MSDRVIFNKDLGVTFASSAKLFLHFQEIACNGSPASLAIKCALRNLSVPYEINNYQKLQQVKVLFFYGPELSGLCDTDAKSAAFLRQIKRFLCVRRSTRNAVVLAEAGLLPLAA